MWKLTIGSLDLIYSTMKEIKKDFPFLDKDRIYNLRKRNKNIWSKNKKFNEFIKIEKIK